ncbi:hypothetical protein [uncultured Methanobrevibacter sp.]|uniref:hypothetical protein n=1 Tax=uncultured Methanobrevibacter sp. TaxID=253161 RepID=UPI0025EFCB31|nr:hypothetical protein [uncultured Methanobrevibacter sp.]
MILSDDTFDIELKDDETYLNEIKSIIKMANDYATCLFITDQFIDDSHLLQVKLDQLDDLKSNYDLIILNLNKSLFNLNESDKVNAFLKVLSTLKTDETIFISKNSYQLLTSGRKGVEALIKVLDYNIEVPPYYMYDFIIASRKQ